MSKLRMTKIGPALITGLISGLIFGLMATAAVSQSDHCKGVRLDHALGDNLQLLKSDGTNAEVIPGSDLSESLEVFDCDQRYYAVIWNKQPRWVKRSSVVPFDHKLEAKPCKDAGDRDKSKFGVSGSGDTNCT